MPASAFFLYSKMFFFTCRDSTSMSTSSMRSSLYAPASSMKWRVNAKLAKFCSAVEKTEHKKAKIENETKISREARKFF